MVAPNLKAETISLMDMRASMEAKMDAIIESLCGPSGPGLSDNLVDSEGFPRTDIDVSAVRSQRRWLAELRNDHKDITGQIEKNLQVLHSLKLNKVTPPQLESSGLFRFDAMALDGSEIRTRFQHLLVQLQIEAGVLERIVYRNKNQHRHGSYF